MSTLQTIQSNIPLPSPLEQLVGMVNSEAIEYAGRDDDTRQLQKWLDAGDFRMVEHSAKSIIERQRQFRQAQQHLPLDHDITVLWIKDIPVAGGNFGQKREDDAADQANSGHGQDGAQMTKAVCLDVIAVVVKAHPGKPVQVSGIHLAIDGHYCPLSANPGLFLSKKGNPRMSDSARRSPVADRKLIA